MSEAKTQVNDAPVEDFIAAVEPPAKQDDARVLLDLFEKVTGEKARMWGDSIIGFGEYKTTYASGRDVHWMRAGFSPRKAKHSLYLMGGYCDDIAAKRREEALGRLGKHKTGKSCLYINKLADVDLEVLEDMIAADWEAMGRIYPE
ncbi:hypothetical protein NAP1_07090 [Erythrobacter sp. NAP1]|uniref:DUF1801 domain-containing protein n=1 Tax=Erythrobacter sp. NAP1 TaxID=237727 RepID=UPI00006869F7|nr:DUF1801 domain-containing protein [Erythrobacter sp. NAP1]EAQ30524.1 hypothetical protein NAP1_07090 [Erythrobacter sp. NAP1]